MMWIEISSYAFGAVLRTTWGLPASSAVPYIVGPREISDNSFKPNPFRGWLNSGVNPVWSSSVLNSISHIALVVSDPVRTARLFEALFATRTVRRVDAEGHDETFVELGNTWFVLVKAAVERPRTGDHIAFHVTKSDLLTTAEKLKAMNLEFVLARSDSALYFFDYDNHVFELDTTDVGSELSHEG